MRQARAGPLLQELNAWLGAMVGRVSAKSEFAAAIGYSLTRWKALTRYVDDGRIEIDIADNGAGIPPEHEALIFEKFARLDDPARAGGAGLGLAICREIMQFLGGSIAYLPGQGGAAFRISLPPRPPARTGAAGENAANAAG